MSATRRPDTACWHRLLRGPQRPPTALCTLVPTLFFQKCPQNIKMLTDSVSLKDQYETQGFVIIPGLIAPGKQHELQVACDNIIARTRAGNWPYRRVVGKQFPPYGNDGPDSWGVQHVMHPDLAEPVFAEFYTSPELRAAVKLLLDCQDEHLQMELFNLLINPASHDFALRWHRDDVKETASEQEERNALIAWHHGVQWNTALYEDGSLYVVPGSHRTPRTAAQRALSVVHNPPDDPSSMPGAIQVILKPGETAFYNSNILHCATYSPDKRRATLHASMGDARGGTTRARNVLQHGLTWMKGDRFRGTLNAEGRAMLDKLLTMQQTVGDSIGYSLDN
ncbi:hypothetical protein BV25DRAFT_1822294 [Artomyces pyxidatus]|uniref:Uncharacterized protein n=1 Tax=Artomyces pyxidatus TaxID=48021 RepID=A0ACB8T9A5_9AGAM|nr:hypothetical protein BV25DRAFT_1822294 [Artomyces pyxidatus]